MIHAGDDAVGVRSPRDLERLADELGLTVDDLRRRDPEGVQSVLEGEHAFVKIRGEIPPPFSEGPGEARRGRVRRLRARRAPAYSYALRHRVF